MTHVFSFELWPDNHRPYNTYPIQLPARSERYQAATPEQARAAATAEAPEGFSVGAGSHHRAGCQPPHPGRDVPYQEER